jgi:uncharacterized protein
MRATLDTNTVISGSLWHGPPHRLLKAAEPDDDFLELFTTSELLAELEEVLSRPKFAARLELANKTVREVVEEFANAAEIVIPERIEPVVIRDPDDDTVLACAVASQSDVIVSGDKDLLDLGEYQDIRILKAADLLTELGL